MRLECILYKFNNIYEVRAVKISSYYDFDYVRGVIVLENKRAYSIKIYEIKPLIIDMSRNNARIDKFCFKYKDVKFEVIVALDHEPFELLFGVVGYNLSFCLNLYKGYELESIPNDVFYKLCKILDLKPNKDEFNSFKFLKYFATKIPNQYSGRKLEPHERAIYKKNNVPEADKIYFCGWKFYAGSERHAKNFEKTREWLGDEAYFFCKEHDISSCWTDKIELRKDYYLPQDFYSNNSK